MTEAERKKRKRQRNLDWKTAHRAEIREADRRRLALLQGDALERLRERRRRNNIAAKKRKAEKQGRVYMSLAERCAFYAQARAEKERAKEEERARERLAAAERASVPELPPKPIRERRNTETPEARKERRRLYEHQARKRRAAEQGRTFVSPAERRAAAAQKRATRANLSPYARAVQAGLADHARSSRFQPTGGPPVSFDDLGVLFGAGNEVLLPSQLAAERSLEARDEYWRLKWAVLNRSLLDLEGWFDVHQRLRDPDACDSDEPIENLESWFLDDEFGFRPARLTTESSDADSEAAPFSSIQPCDEFWTVHSSDGVFSFRAIADLFRLDIEATRKHLRAWIARRRAGGFDRLIPDYRRTPYTKPLGRPLRKKPASASLSSDELIDAPKQRAEKLREVVKRRSYGQSIESIAADLHLNVGAVRDELIKHRDALPQNLAPRRRRSSRSIARASKHQPPTLAERLASRRARAAQIREQNKQAAAA